MKCVMIFLVLTLVVIMAELGESMSPPFYRPIYKINFIVPQENIGLQQSLEFII
uniref:Uncharacterized protein n=1 Tax=Sparus aurata TaxID=8175 RepID=A0A671WKL9_SPAAU